MEGSPLTKMVLYNVEYGEQEQEGAISNEQYQEVVFSNTNYNEKTDINLFFHFHLHTLLMSVSARKLLFSINTSTDQ
jgi:hypothetical protein